MPTAQVRFAGCAARHVIRSSRFPMHALLSRRLQLLHRTASEHLPGADAESCACSVGFCIPCEPGDAWVVGRAV